MTTVTIIDASLSSQRLSWSLELLDETFMATQKEMFPQSLKGQDTLSE